MERDVNANKDIQERDAQLAWTVLVCARRFADACEDGDFESAERGVALAMDEYARRMVTGS